MPTSLIKETDLDVLIIGAGPAGLMCANGLAKAGVNVRIVDKRPTASVDGADGVQPRSIEVLQSYGLAERLLKEAAQVHVAAFYNPSSEGGIELTDRAPDVNTPTARYPFEATLHQAAIEAIFLDSMRSMGVEVSRAVIPTSIQFSQNEAEWKDPQSHPVRVVLKHVNASEDQIDTEIVHAKFVVGADGAHSWVRKSMGIDMEGEQTDYIWGVLDMVPDTDFPDIRNRCAIHSDNGACMIIPREDDKVRLYVQLGDSDAVDTASGRIDKGKMGPHQLLDVARKSFHPFTIKTPEHFDWWSIYIIGQRVASKFSVHERVFISGDACHTHSPKAGQGMNASMNDTHNLIWKLTHVLRGWADMSLLKTYESERRKYAQELINFDKKFSALFSGKPRTESNQSGVSHEEFLKAFKAFGSFTSGIGIHYAESAIVDVTHQSCAKNLIIGQRMPPQILIRAADTRPVELHDLLLSDTRFKVLVFAGDTSLPAQRARVNKLAEEVGKPEGFLQRLTPPGKGDSVFDIISISSAKKSNVGYNDLPELFRPHWSKVLIDDTDVRETQGGRAYSSFGISPSGALVIVRPDGYVGMVAPFDRVCDIDAYFSSFMKS